MKQNYRRQYSRYISSFEILASLLFGHPCCEVSLFCFDFLTQMDKSIARKETKTHQGQGNCEPRFEFQQVVEVSSFISGQNIPVYFMRE